MLRATSSGMELKFNGDLIFVISDETIIFSKFIKFRCVKKEAKLKRKSGGGRSEYVSCDGCLCTGVACFLLKCILTDFVVGPRGSF